MSWIQTAKVGDRVVCLRDDYITHDGRLCKDVYNVPAIGRVYTIRTIEVYVYGVYLRFVEVNNDLVGGYEPDFHWAGFRPVQPRVTDISVFTRLLNAVPSEMEEA